jgi:pectin lyase
VLSQTFDFTGSSVSGSGCAPWGTGAGCQTAINKDEAGLIPIIVASDKTIIGSGSAGVIKGKGLRIVGGSNIILQNIHITELNPQYVWGGDAITLEGSDMVWIDHVKVKRVFKGARKNLDSHLSNRLP